VDAISQSFVEGAADMQAVRKAARDLGHEPFLIAKIERSRALERLDEILEASDGIMIARGDLGVEVPIERIAGCAEGHHAPGQSTGQAQSSPPPKCWSP
jgi:pyruvate kinase